MNEGRTTLRDDLIAAKALIDTPEKLGKGMRSFFDAPERVDRGLPVCAAGACAAVVGSTSGGERYSRMHLALVGALPPGVKWPEEESPGAALPYFNDDPDTTHADIMALFDRAIASAESSS